MDVDEEERCVIVVDENGAEIHKALCLRLTQCRNPTRDAGQATVFNPPRFLNLHKADACGWLPQRARVPA
jgi:hypothetical protein